MAYLPTVEFGPGMTSATEIRTAWPTLNPKRKTALVMSLYPQTQQNPKLAKNVVKMLDTAIGSELAESNMLGTQPTFQVSSYDDFNTAFEVEMIIDNNNAGFFSYQYFPETNDVENDVDIHSDQFRGQGYGKMLLLKAIETAQEHNLPFKVDRNGVTPAQGNVYRSLLADKIIRINPDKTIIATGRSLPGSDMSENQGWAATFTSEETGQMAGTPAIGGMWAGYQARENQPIDEDYIDEKWSQKYKSSINCANPKGFSQRAHCAGRKK
jgi:GNAT superfamily N-acetyltransferase